MGPAISVVMPVYNQARYIRAALDSILRQTFTDFDFLIIDDGSTDGTPRLLERIDDPRVRVTRTKHAGFLSALRCGLGMARGRWVARMDSDDVCHPRRLERLHGFVALHPECLFVSSIHGLITPNDQFLRPVHTFEWRYLKREDITLHPHSFTEPGTLFDRNAALAVGAYDADFENEKPLYYKLLRRGAGAVLGDPLYFYRPLLGSFWHSNVTQRLETAQQVRLRYDPENVAQFSSQNRMPPVDAYTGMINLAGGLFGVYLHAGDWAAAREVAFRAWRTRPLRGRAIVLAIQSLFRLRSWRFWRKSRVPDEFVPVPHPW